MTAVALRSRRLEFQDEHPFDTSTQEKLIVAARGLETDLAVPEARAAEAFATPTLGLLPIVQSK